MPQVFVSSKEVLRDMRRAYLWKRRQAQLARVETAPFRMRRLTASRYAPADLRLIRAREVNFRGEMQR